MCGNYIGTPSVTSGSQRLQLPQKQRHLVLAVKVIVVFWCLPNAVQCGISINYICLDSHTNFHRRRDYVPFQLYDPHSISYFHAWGWKQIIWISSQCSQKLRTSRADYRSPTSKTKSVNISAGACRLYAPLTVLRSRQHSGQSTARTANEWLSSAFFIEAIKSCLQIKELSWSRPHNKSNSLIGHGPVGVWPMRHPRKRKGRRVCKTKC